MKYAILASAFLLSSTAAFAADAVVYEEPVAPAVVDTFSWTGGYIGVNAGYAGGKFKSDLNDFDGGLSLRDTASGFVGGIQAGYNWQMDQFILGLETDIQASSLQSKFEVTDGVNSASLGTKIKWFGTTRVRLGYTPVDRFMVYATGGVAYGKVDTYQNLFDYSSQSKTKVGYTVGAGAEYAITNNVTIKSEYLYTDLGKMKLDAVEDGQTFRIGEAKSAFHTVRVGLNYKF